MNDYINVLKQEYARVEKKLDKLAEEKENSFTYNNFLAYHETLGAYREIKRVLNLVLNKNEQKSA